MYIHLSINHKSQFKNGDLYGQEIERKAHTRIVTVRFLSISQGFTSEE